MKISLTKLSLLSLLFTLPAVAGHNYFYDYARVVKTEPVYHYVEHSHPVHHCYPNKRKRYRGYHSSHHDSTTPTIVGAIVGGAIGHAIGNNKTNKRIGLAAGAILGGSIGHDIGERHNSPGYRYNQGSHNRHGYDRHGYGHYSHHEHGERCTVSYEHGTTVKKLRGYNVTYRYKGERFHTFTKHHPGKRIKLKVNVTPAVHNY